MACFSRLYPRGFGYNAKVRKKSAFFSPHLAQAAQFLLDPDHNQFQIFDFRPNWEEIVLTYRKVWDWSNNFSIHLYARFMPLVDKPERTIDEIKYLNTTYGEIARFVLFGTSTLFDLPQT